MSTAGEDKIATHSTAHAKRFGRGWGRVRRFAAWFKACPTWGRWSIGVSIGLLVLVLVLVATDIVVAAGRIHPGVRIGGVEVGGMTRETAAERTTDELGPRLSMPLTVVFEDHSWDVEADDMGAVLDHESYAEEAYGVGRRGSLWWRVRERILLWFAGGDIEVYVLGESARAAEVFDSFDEEIGIDPVDASIEIEDTVPRIVPSTIGRQVDRESAESAILSGFMADDVRQVDLPVRLVPVGVADADAQKALDDATVMLSDVLALSHEAEEWEISPQEIAGWIGFRANPFEGEGPAEAGTSTVSSPTESPSTETTVTDLPGRMVLEAYLIADEVSATVAPLTRDVGRHPQDARFQVSSGSVSIVPSEVGLRVDLEALIDTLLVVLRKEGDDRSAALRMMAVQPVLTTEEAETMGIDDRLARYRTTYSSSNTPRVSNIHTLARALDGTLIPPGSTFSFNDTVGPRTADKGYVEAGTIVNGRLVPTLGGGICQVGTTMFNTVFFAGLPVDERYNHSFYISSYPTGRDATVSWGGPDLRFTNDTSAWILIATGYTSSSITISFYGTDQGYEVEYITGPWRDVRPFASTEIPDPELDEGIRIIEEGGIDGRAVTVTRRVYKDSVLLREDTFSSKYNPKQEYVRVGTKPIPETDPEGSEEETSTLVE